jgi:hypothetical protein
MTSCTFIVTHGKAKFYIRVSHDGHPKGVFAAPLFKALKRNVVPTIETVLSTLIRAEDPYFCIELWKKEAMATGSDYICCVDLSRRTWKFDGYKERVF